MKVHTEFELAGVVMKEHLASAQTGGSFSLFENHSAGPSRTPIHVHARDDETLFMLYGEMRAVLAGEQHTIRAGESLFLPRGVPHQLMNCNEDPARYLLLCTPGGFEGFLAEGGHVMAPGESPRAPSTADIDRIRTAAPLYGITLFPDWSAAKAYERQTTTTERELHNAEQDS